MASATLKKVSKVGLRIPRSIALKCVLPISARPLTTSCDKPHFSLYLTSCLSDKQPPSDSTNEADSSTTSDLTDTPETAQTPVFNLFSEIYISFSGVDGYGIANIEFSDSLPQILKRSISYSLSSSQNLKNDQKITLNLAYDSEFLRKNGYNIADKSFEYTVYGLKELISIDPFEGLEVDYYGISPFCTAVINNSKCSEDAQAYVNYSIDGDYFANGDVVVIHAEIPQTITEQYGYFVETEKATANFKVSDMPYYIESLDNFEVSLIERELTDYVISQTSFERNWELFNINAKSFLDKYGDGGNTYCSFFNVNSVKSEEAYLLTIKSTAKDKFLSQEVKQYNSLRVLAICTAEASHQDSPKKWWGQGNIYITFKSML